jgi:hypothetical protein
MGLKVILRDFDGTLGFRRGGWTGCLLDAVTETCPEHGTTLRHLRFDS